MNLLNNQSDWATLKPNLLKQFNITGKIKGVPERYPCMVYSLPIIDVNGYGVRCVFFYIEDAKKLLALAGDCDIITL